MQPNGMERDGRSRWRGPAGRGRQPGPAGAPPGGRPGGAPGGGGGGGRGPGGGLPNFRMLWRAVRYVGRYNRLVLIAYGSLFVATAAQLMVPQLVQNIIDTIVRGYTAGQILGLPANAQPLAAQRLNTTLAQLQADRSGATRAILLAMLAIVVFALVRAVFAFLQLYNAERISQNVAFDFRNELFARIQCLSFSYHDRNQTGQLMIRATDDVEKVRLFLGQGLALALQALVLLVATLIVLWFTNSALTLVVLPILPVAFVVFFVFGAVAQPLFMQVQIRISRLNTILQENVAGLKVVK